jgi:hypothetical protein
LDLASGYYQLGLDESSRAYTAFPTPFGLYQWKVMPMGLCNAPAIFQKAMNEILREHIEGGYCLVYLDDIIILSKTPEEHAEHLDKVLSSLHAHNLFCQLPKCQWVKSELKYLGHIVSGTTIKPDPEKIKILDGWQPPLEFVRVLSDDTSSSAQLRTSRQHLVHECRRYLGFMNYFSRFLPRYSSVAACLHDQVKDDAPPWSDEHTRAWHELAAMLRRVTMLYHPVFGKPFHVFFDASIRAIGGALMQEHEGELRPVAFCARKLTSAEINYTTTEQEMLAMVFCFKQWRCYLEGTQTFLHTDHEPLTWLATQPLPNRRQARWLEFLSRFQFELLYVKGDKNVVADALSRMLQPPAAGCDDLPGESWPSEIAVCRTAGNHGAAQEIGEYANVGSTDVLPATRAGASRSGPRLPPPCVLAILPFCAAGGYTRRRPHGSQSCAGEDAGASGGSAARATLSNGCGEQRPANGSGKDSNRATVSGNNSTDGTHNIRDLDTSHANDRLFDELFERVRVALRSDVVTRTPEQRDKLGLKTDHDLLWKDHRLYVPEDASLRQDILFWHHDVPWCAHLGMQRTLELVKRQFFWPKMNADIRDYIASCRSCQANKPDRRRSKVPLTPLLAPDACWHTLGVDLIVDLPPTCADGYDAICVFVCHLSKMVRLVPTHTTLDTRGFAKLFVREIFPHYGMPSAIVSDRGRQWNSDFFREICSKTGIQLKLSTAYHPQTNGQVERYNEVVAAALRHFVAADLRDWDEYTPFIEFAMNDTYQASSDSTAFRMNRITLPRNPFSALLANSVSSEDNPSTELASWVGMSKLPLSSDLSVQCMRDPAELHEGSRTVLKAHEQFAWARRCIHLAKSRMKERFDAQGAKLHLYEVGQLVWFNIKNIGIRHPSGRQKLLPKYLGPVKVLSTIGRSAVRLDLPESLKIHPTVSVSLVKPFIRRIGADVPPLNIDGACEWEVEAITDHNLLKSRKKDVPSLLEFKVEWKGNFEPSWHEFRDFEHSLDSVEKYIRSCTKSVRAQMYKALQPGELAQLSAGLRKEAARKV